MTGAVVFFPVRVVAGFYSSALAQSTAKKNWKPQSLHPIGRTSDGKEVFLDPAWSRYFSDLGGRKLGGATFPTLPDITEIFSLTNNNATAISQIQTALEQQANANAQAIESLRQVVQTAALVGAEQIPPPVLARQETTPPPVDTFFNNDNGVGSSGGGGGD